MDWRVYRAIYGVSLHHHWVGSLFSAIEAASIPVLAVATVALWLLSRPGGDRKWKFASVTALASSAVGLGINRVISHGIWYRDRPYVTHPESHPWSNAHDASFPSDHSTASFAIAFAVLAFDRVAGAVFLAGATVIATGRLFIGAHYPTDVLTGLLVGIVSALIATKLLGPLLRPLARQVERLTDPVLASLWQLAGK